MIASAKETPNLEDYQLSENQFLYEFPEFSSTAILDVLRKTDYARLDSGNHLYLDYTGGNLYAQSQIDKHFENLKQHVFGNPHSTNPSSQLAEKNIAETRAAISRFFDAEDYHIVFTSNASNALKIIGECYPFHVNGHFLLLFDNHNSVNGIREYAKLRGASHTYSPVKVEDLRLDETRLLEHLQAHPGKENKLFAYPAQSNVSGVKHDLSWIKTAHQHGWDVLLDAAAFVPSNRLKLKDWQPEFVTLSFYKIFGYPTGLGALFIHKKAFNKLQKPWFAGGTVRLVAVSSDNFFLAENYERHEDGTLNYLGIPALKIGIDHIEKIGIDTINTRVNLLTIWLLRALKSLKHSNGNELVHVFGPGADADRGGTIIFNLFDRQGQPLPYEHIEQDANREMISLRTGCFCNPGIDEINNCISSQELSAYFTSPFTGNYHEMIWKLGKMRGAIRVSLGLASNFKDVYRFVQFLKNYLT